MKVAFATQDLEKVDAHFGCARHLVVWEISAAEARPLDTFSFPEAEEDGDHDKLGPRVEALGGCAVVFVAAIGASASSLALSRGVLPVRVAGGESIAEAATRLSRVLCGTPPPWLRKVLEKDERRLAETEG